MGREGPRTPAGKQRAGAGAGSAGDKTPGTRTRHSAHALIDAVFARETPRDRTPEPAARGREAPACGLGNERVLQSALERLVRVSGCARAVAWGHAGTQRSAFVLASPAPGQDAEVLGPAEALVALLALPAATDLGAAGTDPVLQQFAARTGLAAAVSLRSGDTALALLVSRDSEASGSVRPRTLAAVAEAARELQEPLANRLALGPLERLDEDVRRLDRLAALGDLLAEVVHEVRNPLVSVKTFLQLLPERLGDPEFLGDFRQLVCEEVLRLERLLDEVLRHSRPGSSAGRGDGADVGASFASVAHLVAHRARERGIEIEREVGAGIDRVAIGRDALRQLLLNLTLNALDATPAGSRIRLGAQNDPCGEGVCISVEDEGCGVAEADRARIFEPFHSTRSERPGGLGLAISRRLVEECGGRIEVRDSASGGACFVVRLATHG